MAFFAFWYSYEQKIFCEEKVNTCVSWNKKAANIIATGSISLNTLAELFTCYAIIGVGCISDVTHLGFP